MGVLGIDTIGEDDLPAGRSLADPDLAVMAIRRGGGEEENPFAVRAFRRNVEVSMQLSRSAPGATGCTLTGPCHFAKESSELAMAKTNRRLR
jgi:hypothetical protein